MQAAGQLEALRIRKDHFLKLLTEFPEMTIEIMRVLADRLSHTTAELTEARSQKDRSKTMSAHSAGLPEGFRGSTPSFKRLRL